MTDFAATDVWTDAHASDVSTGLSATNKSRQSDTDTDSDAGICARSAAGNVRRMLQVEADTENQRRPTPSTTGKQRRMADTESPSDVDTDSAARIFCQKQRPTPNTAGKQRRMADTESPSDVDTDSAARIFCQKQRPTPSTAGKVRRALQVEADTESPNDVDMDDDCPPGLVFDTDSDVDTDCRSTAREQRRTQPCQAKKEATRFCKPCGAQLGHLTPEGDAGGRCLQKDRAQLILDLVHRCRRGKCACWRQDCKLRCKSQISASVSEIADFLLPAYNCTPAAQDMVFSDLLKPAPEFQGDRGQVAYAIAGIRVCRLAVERLLGIGRDRANRVRKGLQDGRRGKRGIACKPHSEAWSEIYGHLWSVYEWVAEWKADESVVIVDRDKPTAEPNPEHRRAAEALKREFEREGCFGAAGTRLLSTDKLPCKYLPPGCPKDYWWTFLGTPGNERFAKSYDTFKRVWREFFQNILSFKTFDEHCACSTCSELKASIRSARDMATKIQQAELYNQHLQQQWRDRLIYWRVRALSRERDGGWLCIMIDGADQAKFRVLKAQRWPSDFDNVYRPQLQVVGCLAHGYECSFNFREDDVGKGSEFVLEVLTRCIQRVFAQCDEEGKRRPAHLWLQSDNCSGENKNQWIQRYLATLVDRGIFRSAVDAYLSKGHTHEDLDQHFGVMSGHISAKMNWDTPQEMAGHVQQRMARHLDPLPVSAGIIGDVRNWKEWLDPLDDIHTKGGIVGITGKAASHYYHYCRRRDLPAEVVGNVRAPQDSVDPNDVVVMEREFMSSPDLRQQVLTFCRAGASWHLPSDPRRWRPRDPFSQAYFNGLKHLARLVVKHFPEKAGAVSYLRAFLSRPRSPVGPPPALTLFSQQQTRSTLMVSMPVGHALHTVQSAGGGQVQRMGLKRRRAKTDPFSAQVASVSLQTWVAFRVSQGQTAKEAELEWRGAQQF